jgi:hypothetical protein
MFPDGIPAPISGAGPARVTLMNTPGSGDARRRDAASTGGHRHPWWRAPAGAGQAIEVPTYGPDGEHQLLIPVEVDDQGAPPATVGLRGCDSTDRPQRRHYTGDRDEAGWMYVQTTRSVGNFR